MSLDSRETDDRLKSRLNSDQVGRERMCTAILALDRSYSRIQPRRPEGGPDGTRDIQAIRNGSTEVWGAVGFQNSVTDSADDKRQAKKKFKADVDAALAVKPDLKAFVFFTNVDLTPAERDELEQYARSKNISDIEIYWRERLRLQLDSPLGLGLRYQYLKMNLSDAEQSSFFSSYGSQLEELILTQHKEVYGVVSRLEFLHRMSRPLFLMRLVVHLKQPVNGFSKIGHFRALAKIFTVPEGGGRTWYLGGSDAHSGTDKIRESFGTDTFYSISETAKQPTKLLELPSHSKLFQPIHSSLRFSIGYGPGSPVTPEVLDGLVFRFFVTENLASLIESVSLDVNGYRLIHASRFKFEKYPVDDIEWPKPVPFGGTLTDWVEGLEWLPHIDFSETPPKSPD